LSRCFFVEGDSEWVKMPHNSNHIPTQSEPGNPFPELDVRSEDVQEIIGRPPHGLIRWGITGFFGVLALVLIAASLIRYPEVVRAPLLITAIDAPKTLEGRTNGKLVRLLAENNEKVEKGQVLAWMESTAGHGQVLRLSAEIDTLRSRIIKGNTGSVGSLELSSFGELGEVQPAFQAFEQAWREHISHLVGGFYPQQRKNLQQEMAYTGQLLENLYEQKKIQQADYELARREYDIQRQLADREYLAPIEIVRAERELSARRLPLQQTEAAIINNRASQIAQQKEIMEMDRRKEEQSAELLQAIHSLRSAIDEWKQNYLVTAPFDGKLIYAGIIQENQTITAGRPLFYLHPEETSYFGEVALAQASFGKVSEGQQVLVQLNGYPYAEFGSVYGQVEYISEIPVRDSLFFARIEFPSGLVTNYGRQIPPRNGMTGQAEIITQNMRLLERVVNNITKELR